MKIYLLTQKENNDYDTFDSMVVIAKDEERARNIHPISSWEHNEGIPMADLWKRDSGVWASKPENVFVTELGTARKGATEGVKCASFNAG